MKIRNKTLSRERKEYRSLSHFTLDVRNTAVRGYSETPTQFVLPVTDPASLDTGRLRRKTFVYTAVAVSPLSVTLTRVGCEKFV